MKRFEVKKNLIDYSIWDNLKQNWYAGDSRHMHTSFDRQILQAECDRLNAAYDHKSKETLAWEYCKSYLRDAEPAKLKIIEDCLKRQDPKDTVIKIKVSAVTKKRVQCKCCPICGNTVKEHSRYCDECGQAVIVR